MREYTSKKDGTVKVPTPFKLDGVEFMGAVSFLDILPLADFASVELDASGNLPPDSAKALVEFYRAALGQDYERFAAHVRQHGTEAMVLLQVMMDLMEDASAGLFPTAPSSPSPGGDGGTGPLSPDVLAVVATLSEQDRTAVQGVGMLARMRHEAAQQFGGPPPPLPPGIVPTGLRPEVQALFDQMLQNPSMCAAVLAAVGSTHPSPSPL
jgi:hypothetical protein